MPHVPAVDSVLPAIMPIASKYTDIAMAMIPEQFPLLPPKPDLQGTLSPGQGYNDEGSGPSIHELNSSPDKQSPQKPSKTGLVPLVELHPELHYESKSESLVNNFLRNGMFTTSHIAN